MRAVTACMALTGACIAGSLVPVIGTQGVFGLTALFPLAVSLAALLIAEERAELPSAQSQGGAPQAAQPLLVAPLSCTASAQGACCPL